MQGLKIFRIKKEITKGIENYIVKNIRNLFKRIKENTAIKERICRHIRKFFECSKGQ